MSRPKVVARMAWRCLWRPGTEVASLAALEHGWRLAGRAELVFAEGTRTVRYRVDCTSGWEPRSAEVVVRSPSSTRRVEILVDEAHEWTVGGFRNPELSGCSDVDFTATPATITSPLRRLGRPVGGRQELRTAWFMFPDLEGRAVRQRYTRLSDRHYRYEGFNNNIVGEFDVDELGLVTDYPRAWERIPTPATRPRSSGGKGGRTRASILK